MGWFRRLRSTIFPSRQQREIDEELRFHVEQRVENFVRAGMREEEARQHALRRFGNPLVMRERAGDANAYRWLADALQDAKHALRVLRQQPSFTVGALLTLALGIGATSTVFTVVYGVLLRPLPYPSADRLVRVWEEHPGGSTGAGNRWISNRTYWAWSERPRTIDVLVPTAALTRRCGSARTMCDCLVPKSRRRCCPRSAPRHASAGCSPLPTQKVPAGR